MKEWKDLQTECRIQSLLGTSLVAQRIKIHLPTRDTWVWSLVQEDATCQGATKPVRCNYWTRVLQLELPQLGGSKSNDIPVAYTVPRSWFLIQFSNNRNQGSLRAWVFWGLKQVIDKIRLENLILSENTEVLNRLKLRWGYIKGRDIGVNQKSSKWSSWYNLK